MGPVTSALAAVVGHGSVGAYLTHHSKAITVVVVPLSLDHHSLDPVAGPKHKPFHLTLNPLRGDKD